MALPGKIQMRQTYQKREKCFACKKGAVRTQLVEVLPIGQEPPFEKDNRAPEWWSPWGAHPSPKDSLGFTFYASSLPVPKKCTVKGWETNAWLSLSREAQKAWVAKAESASKQKQVAENGQHLCGNCLYCQDRFCQDRSGDEQVLHNTSWYNLHPAFVWICILCQKIIGKDCAIQQSFNGICASCQALGFRRMFKATIQEQLPECFSDLVDLVWNYLC